MNNFDETDYNYLIAYYLQLHSTGIQDLYTLRYKESPIPNCIQYSVLSPKTTFKYMGIMINTAKIVIFEGCHITICSLRRDDYGVSFQFTGCAMVKFEYQGTLYICHIALSEAGKMDDCRILWKIFLNRNRNSIKNLVMFKPYKNKPLHDPRNENVCGVITPNNQCHSFIVNNINYIARYETPIKPLCDINNLTDNMNFMSAINSIDLT